MKGNQGNLEQAIADTVLPENPITVDKQEDFGHGRIESRTCYAYGEPGHIENHEKWEGLKSIVKIETETYEKSSGKTAKEQRYYISSLPPDASVLNSRIRKHWSVENNLHCTLDVEFGEDRSRKRAGNVAENHNIVLKMAMTMLATDNSKKTSKRTKRLKAALNPKNRDKLWGF